MSIEFVKVMEAAAETIKEMLVEDEAIIKEAYDNQGPDEALAVSISLKLVPKGATIETKADLSFVMSKFKDSNLKVVSSQAELPLDTGVPEVI